MTLLKGKRIIIFGLVNRHSMAYGIAKSMQQAGAELAFSVQNETMAERVRPWVKDEFDTSFCEVCDVRSDIEISTLFNNLKQHWNQLDSLVHAIAYAPKDQFKGDYLSTVTRESFQAAHEVSSYSFTALAQSACFMMPKGASLLTLSYLGAERTMASYNVMGLAKASLEANVRYMANSLGPSQIRVNAISSGPIKTVAASAIKNLNRMLAFHEKTAPLRQLTTVDQVGNAAVCLCSDLMSGVTGEILHVDGGFHSVIPLVE